MTRKIKTVALIVAGGSSSRFGGGLPKQYELLGGKPVLRHTVEEFLQHPQIDGVLVVIGEEHGEWYAEAMRGAGSKEQGATLFPPVIGGATRQASVKKGLEAIEQHQPAYVLIHDAARPFVSSALITRVVDTLEHNEAVVPALALTDTLKQVEGGKITGTVDRNTLAAVQTPQGFRYATILALHQKTANVDITDDAGLCEQARVAVATVQGESRNFKITTQDDMERAATMHPYETRTGTGFDVHGFEEIKDYEDSMSESALSASKASRPSAQARKPERGAINGVVLCGVKIPHTHKLKGHSDADAGLHALVDALLGAIGEGDIGQHFPPSDPQWKGVDSGKFVEHAVKLVKEKGGHVINVDITIICEQPKVGKHRETMRQRVAELLGISPDRVNIKATTTEQLGFTGRGEGIAAQAVANVAMAGGTHGG